ncbi:TetR family transcriptional regulator [Rhodococcus sp. 1168]|uniref:TetR family transcriptional regulator n=1 Tax=Rhodococcus sp. 1168 TaxID=2018041 RepID=UPI0015942595|nr:TetR family transcriptional regulator [Rhodococcus sp. 1168]
MPITRTDTAQSRPLERDATRIATDALRSEIGARVRVQRKLREMSLRDLARELGVSAATLSAVENGHTGLTTVRLAQIAGVLGIQPSTLVPADELPTLNAHPVRKPEPASVHNGWRTYSPLEIDPILSAALRLFVDVGFHGATMREIAGLAGMSVAGVYHHYSSKQDVLAALLDLAMEDLLARSTDARNEGATPVERFALIVECLALFHTHRRDLGFVGASETRSMTGVHRSRLTSSRLAQQRMVDEEIALGMQAGVFTVNSPQQAGRAVTMLCTGLCQWFRECSSVSAEDIARDYVQYALNLVGYRHQIEFDTNPETIDFVDEK